MRCVACDNCSTVCGDAIKKFSWVLLVNCCSQRRMATAVWRRSKVKWIGRPRKNVVKTLRGWWNKRDYWKSTTPQLLQQVGWPCNIALLRRYQDIRNAWHSLSFHQYSFLFYSHSKSLSTTHPSFVTADCVRQTDEGCAADKANMWCEPRHAGQPEAWPAVTVSGNVSSSFMLHHRGTRHTQWNSICEKIQWLATYVTGLYCHIATIPVTG